MNFKDFYGKYSLDGTFTPGKYYSYIRESRGYNSINATMGKFCGAADPLDKILYTKFKYYSVEDDTAEDRAMDIIALMDTSAERFSTLATFDMQTYAEKTDNDWLKDLIQSAITNTTAEGSSTTSGSSQNDFTSNIKFTGKDTSTDNETRGETHGGKDTSSLTSETNHTGTETRQTSSDETRTDNLAHEETSTETLNTTVTATSTGTIADTKTLTGKDTRTDALKQATIGTSSSESNNSATTDHKEIAKNLPNSISYGTAAAGSIPELSWTHATGQGQSQDKTSSKETVTENNSTTSDNTGTQTTDKTSAENDTRTLDTTNSTKNSGTNQTASSGTNTGTQKTASTGTDGVEKNLKDIETSSTTNSYGGTVDTTAARTGEIDRSSTTNTTNHGTGETSATTTTKNSGNADNTSDGRHTTLASLYKEAFNVLTRSSAVDWLLDKLLLCFLLVYDV